MGNQQLTGCLSAPMDADESSSKSKSKSKPKSKPKPKPKFQNTESSSLSTSSSIYSEIASSHSTDIDSHHYKRNVKLLFLDVDGVLNSQYLQWNKDNDGIDDQLLKYLKAIVLRTNCKIVLSTTWRLHYRAKQILIHSIKTRCDLNTDDLIIGQTPDLKFCGKHRTDEIEEYIHSNAYKFNIISWCALDDISLNKFDTHSANLMNGHFVKTNSKIGISPTNALNCIDILNANDYDTNSYSLHRYK